MELNTHLNLVLRSRMVELYLHSPIYFHGVLLNRIVGRAIAQVVSSWPPTMAARVRARVWSCWICGGQSGAETGFLRVLWFPLPIFIPPIAPQLPSSIIWGWYNRAVVAAVPSRISVTTLRIIIKRIVMMVRWDMATQCADRALHVQGLILIPPVSGPANNSSSVYRQLT
jgi:hypothetical protein